MSDGSQPPTAIVQAGQRSTSDDNRALEVELVKKRHDDDHEKGDGREGEVKKRKVSDSNPGYATRS